LLLPLPISIVAPTGAFVTGLPQQLYLFFACHGAPSAVIFRFQGQRNPSAHLTPRPLLVLLLLLLLLLLLGSNRPGLLSMRYVGLLGMAGSMAQFVVRYRQQTCKQYSLDMGLRM